MERQVQINSLIVYRHAAPRCAKIEEAGIPSEFSPTDPTLNGGGGEVAENVGREFDVAAVTVQIEHFDRPGERRIICCHWLGVEWCNLHERRRKQAKGSNESPPDSGLRQPSGAFAWARDVWKPDGDSAICPEPATPKEMQHPKGIHAQSPELRGTS